MTAAVALLDANILYPAPLRDLLLELAVDGLFQPRWSAEIEKEWRRNLLRNRPDLTVDKISMTQAMMRRAIPDALVTDFDDDPGLTLPDPDDHHVVAAALACAADVIVTFNLKDFPPDRLADIGLEVCHPDVFLQTLIATAPLSALAGVRHCVGRLTRPPVSAESYIRIIKQLDLLQTADFLHQNSSIWQPIR